MAGGTTFGNLRVTVTADTTKMSKGIKKAQADLTGFSKTAKSIATSLTGIFAGLAAAFSFRAIINGFLSTAEALDEVAKSAAKIGIAAENMGALEVAAKRSGLAFNSVTTAIQRMVRRISEATIADPEKNKVALALREIGLSVEELQGLRPVEQLKRIGDAFQGVESQADKVRLAFTFFDTEGVGMVNVLKDGSAGLDAFRKEADKLGKTFTAEQLAKIEKFNDELGRLKDALGGVWQGTVISLGPDVLSGIQTLKEAMEGIKLLAQELGLLTEKGVEEQGRLSKALEKTLFLPRMARAGVGAAAERLFQPVGAGTEGGITAEERARGAAISRELVLGAAQSRIAETRRRDDAAIKTYEESRKLRLLAEKADREREQIFGTEVSISK